MLSLLAHQSGAGPHTGIWSHWYADPIVVLGIAALALVYQRAKAPRRGRRRPAGMFWTGLVTVAVALASPLDALAGDLASAHMVQHVLLVLVAAPLLVLSAPVASLLGAAPPIVRVPLRRVRRAVRATAWARLLRRPGAAWLLHAGTLWFWHASGPYGAALEHDVLHALEHASFLGTALLFWSSVLPARRPARASEGHAALLVFTMAMQSVFLSMLLTFASSPWYEQYADTTEVWGLDPLADQQLAGVIMWVPAGFVYVAAGLALVVRWVRTAGGDMTASDWESHAAPEGEGAGAGHPPAAPVLLVTEPPKGPATS